MILLFVERHLAFSEFQVPIFFMNYLILQAEVLNNIEPIYSSSLHDKSIYMTLIVIILLSSVLKFTLQLTSTLDKCNERKGGALVESIFFYTEKGIEELTAAFKSSSLLPIYSFGY